MPDVTIARSLKKPSYFHTEMRYIIPLLLFVACSATAQPLQDINYSFLYNPTDPFTFHVRVVKTNNQWNAFYEFALRDTLQPADQFTIQWDVRKDLGDKEGTLIELEKVTKKIEGHKISGNVLLPEFTEKQFLTGKILNSAVKRAWVFQEVLDPKYPVNGYLTAGESAVIDPFIKVQTEVSVVSDGDQRIVSYYDDKFPAAVPGFSEGMAKVARAMVVDSTFTVATNQPLVFSKPGLYLIQKDTNAAEGFAFRVEEDYPRLAKIESLADPLIYVCTKAEFDRVKSAKGEKKAFDRVILSVTGDTERARIFMRSYFRRVELANQFFTSYKEGWKTDRGMIYIIFGLPDQVFKFSDREVWSYKNSSYKITFEFIKSSTLFDPENFVLIREKKFQETWYEVIDLWRNARF
jgi:GWxTD domain-containing protein